MASAINLPLSFYIINLQNKSLRKDDLDASLIEKKCKFLFERANRKFLRVLEYEDIAKGGPAELMKRLTEKVAFDVEQYFDSVVISQNSINLQ